MRTPLPLETSPAAHWGVLVFSLLLPTVATWVYFVALAGRSSVQAAYGASKVVQFALPLVWTLWVQRRSLSLAAPGWLDIGTGFGLGLLFVLAGVGAYLGYFKASPYLSQATGLISERLKDWNLNTTGRFVAFTVFLSLVHALLEEYYWRWFVCGQMARAAAPGWAIAVSSLGFMAHHVIVIHGLLRAPWPLTAALSLSVGVGGAAWAWLYLRSGSLYGPWISHMLVDAAIMWIGYDLVWRR